MYLLDTDTCIFIIKGEKNALQRYRNEGPKTVFISAITYHELLFGALHSVAVEKHLARVELLIGPLTILPFIKKTATLSSTIKQNLAAKGNLIGPLNTLIAATAMEHDLILVTGNTKEFTRVPDLKVENWLKP